MPVGLKNIQPAVVIHVEERSAPANVGERRLGQFSGAAHIGKTVFP